MANASSTLRGVTHFTYGTELEWLAKHKKIIHYALERMGFDHNVRPGSSDARTADVKFTEAGVSKNAPDSNGYKRGNIKPEAVLEDVMDPAGGGYWAMEFVSKVYDTDNPESCEDLEIIYKVLEKNFVLLWTKGTSQHVHVKPKPDPNAEGQTGQWTVPEVRSLLRAAAVFDKAITKVMPENRKSNTWAKSFYDIELKNATKTNQATNNGAIGLGSQLRRNLVDFFGEVPTKTWDGLFKHIDNLKSHWGVCLATNSDREVPWNFMPLMDKKLGTIEFRRPPGAQTAKDAQKWVVFAVAFASASLEQGGGSVALEEGTCNRWRAPGVHQTGLMRLGHNWQNALNPEETFVEIPVEAEPESN